jgi:hypothetical protein
MSELAVMVELLRNRAIGDRYSPGIIFSNKKNHAPAELAVVFQQLRILVLFV